MSDELPSTCEHRAPVQPEGTKRRPAFVCAFPRATALPLPDSGSVVGRAWFAQAGLVDSEVSGAHLQIDRAGGVLRISDAGSRNGTWVNGARLSPKDRTPLDEGAVIRIGRTLLVYRRELAGGLEPAAPIGELVGPYGLRGVAEALAALERDRPQNVLLEGETGVGKELVARAVASALRPQKPLAAVNIAGLARGVFESQLFGHVAGAFSDARVPSPGLVVAHDGGTLFLDEIGELDLDLQAKLLRLLENREVLPVGASRSLRVNISVVAATNRDLEAMVEEGRFRRDLLARLSMVRIEVPALRDRIEDLYPVATALSKRSGFSLPSDRIEVEAMERLLLADYPSNVRGLEAALAAIRRADADPGLRLWAVEEVFGKPSPERAVLTEEMVERALAATGGNISSAAAKLGVSRGKLLRFVRRSKQD